MPIGNGGIFGKVNAPTASSAKGVWSIREAVLASLAGNWPATAVADPYFENVTLLLPGNGTNGAQNNTFLDSSTNAFSITRNGNTTQGTFSPFSQTGWGNYFDGSGDYLTLSSNTSMNFGTSNFTIEGWFYTGDKSVSAGASRTIIGNSGNSYTMQVYISTAGYLTFGNTGSTFLQGATDLANNTWHHFAIARSGTGSNQIAMWVDGSRVALGTNSQNYTSGTIYLGSFDASNGFWNGYLSNLRIVNGTAVYSPSDSTITVPTAPLTAITNTSLLTCQSNRFIDNSSNAFAITRNGDVSVQAFSPFNPTAAWSASTNGGSGYFDGSGDYLGIPDSTDFDLNSTFTIDCWFYQPTAGDGMIFTRGGGAGSWSISNGHEYLIFMQSGTFYWMWNASGSPASISVASPAAGAWHHVAVGYNGTTTRVWIDGASVGTSTTGYTLPTTRNITRVGYAPSNELYFSGYISQVRVVKGTDVYGVSNTSITVPTAPLTAITNTKLLLSTTNAGIYDATSKNDLETSGSVQISTTQNKWNGSSIYFPGTGAYLIGRTSNLASFETGDFTIEGWIYPTSVTGNDKCLWDTRASAPDAGMVVFVNGSSQLSAFTSNAIRITSSTTLTANTWQHFALVRSGGTMAFYINGTQANTASYSSAITCPGRVTVGGRFDDLAPFAGYVNDFRVTKGYARYTSNFTPPTTAFPVF